MTRKLIRIAAATAGMLGSMAAMVAQASADEYRGRGCIIQVNAACNAVGYSVGDCALFRFSPPNALGNDNNTRLSIFYNTYSQNFKMTGSAIGTNWRKPEFSSVGSGGGTATESATVLRIPVVSPASYAGAIVHMIVEIARYDDYGPGYRSNCYTKWRFTGQKNPDPAVASAEAKGPPALALGNGAASLTGE